MVHVVISWKILIFAEAETTRSRRSRHRYRLWLAEKSLSLRKQRQPCRVAVRYAGVVISWKILIFAEAETTEEEREHGRLLLWLAEKSLSLRKQRQHLPPRQHPCQVVISWKILIFAEAETTAKGSFKAVIELWLAEKSLSLRKQRQLAPTAVCVAHKLWLAEKSLSLRKQRQHLHHRGGYSWVVISWKILIFAEAETTFEVA